jgi:hypothetical protein
MVATRLAPVVLFYYNRPEKVELVLDACESLLKDDGVGFPEIWPVEIRG